MGRPTLAQYPHLRQILKNDTTANLQFNQVIASLSGGFVSASKDNDQTAQRQRQLLNEKETELTALRKTLKEQQEIITLLGEVIEPQTHLRPYTQDISDAGTYMVRFTAHQIREALRLHWQLIAQQTEAILRGDVAPKDHDEE